MILIERFQDEAWYRIAHALGKNYGKETEVQDEDTHHCVLRERGNEISPLEFQYSCKLPMSKSIGY